jgi:preprotein translocase subunit YajC
MDALGGILPIILMFAIFYFLLILPQQRRQKKTVAMQNSLEKGNKVVTIGGLHGTVDKIEEHTVVIRSNDGSLLTYDRAAIKTIIND